jgi:hypothetical protein
MRRKPYDRKIPGVRESFQVSAAFGATVGIIDNESNVLHIHSGGIAQEDHLNDRGEQHERQHAPIASDLKELLDHQFPNGFHRFSSF